MPKTWSIVEIAILRTVLYADIFGGTLTFSELSRFLLSGHSFSKNDLVRGLDSLKEDPRTSQVIERVYVGERRRHFPREKWQEITRLVRILSGIPWIESIWVTGSVAVGTPNPSDDIDLLFITSQKRLWLTRCLVVGIGIALGKYRRSNHAEYAVANRWCCNIWMESSALSVFDQRQDVYIAREMIQAFPVYRRWDVSGDSWLRLNEWIRDWCRAGYESALKRAKNTVSIPRSPSLGKFTVFEICTSFLNTCAQELQFFFIRQKQTREEVQSDRAFFHPRNTHHHVLQKYEKMCKEYGV